MARQLCDAVEVGADETGTHVRLVTIVGGGLGPRLVADRR